MPMITARTPEAHAGPTPNQHAAAQVRAHMAARRLTSVQLAEVLGISTSAASRLKLGRINYDLDQLGRIADWLDISLADLVDPAAGYQLTKSA